VQGIARRVFVHQLMHNVGFCDVGYHRFNREQFKTIEESQGIHLHRVIASP